MQLAKKFRERLACRDGVRHRLREILRQVGNGSVYLRTSRVRELLDDSADCLVGQAAGLGGLHEMPAKNRVHLDLRTRELGPEVARIRAAGGVLLTREPMAEFGFRWQVLADPDGNELCVVEPRAEYWPA